MFQHSRAGAAGLWQPEWQQDAVDSFGIRVHGDDGNVADVFGGVGDESVLTDNDHDHEPPEIKGWQKAAIDELQRNVKIQFAPEVGQRFLVDFILNVEVFELFVRGAV